jgi:LysM repeat protein
MDARLAKVWATLHQYFLMVSLRNTGPISISLLMNRRFFRHIFMATVGLGLNFIASASVTYVAKEGDKLSKIAGKMIQGPVWGKNGSLKKVIALNLEIKDSDLIYPGQEIQLPGDEVAQTSSRAPPLSAPKPSCAVCSACAVKRAPATEEETPVTSPSTTPNSTPTLASAPTPVPQENQSGFLLELAPYYALTGISASDKATGNPATLASSVNTGLDMKYYQPWSESFRSFVHLRLGTLSFEQPTDSSKSLLSSSNFMSGIGLGGDFKLSQGLTFSIFGDYQKEAFVRSISTNSVTVDAVAVPELGGRLAFDLLKKNSLTLGISGQFTELFQAPTAGYTVSQGNLYGGIIYFKQDVGGAGSTLTTELGYFSRQQSTDITNQTERDFLLQFRWFLPSGGKTEEPH